jgi:hypothetical protein
MGGVGHGTAIAILETSLMAFVHRVLVFGLDLQDHLFSDNSAECHGHVGRSRVPILNSPCINEASTFAHSQYYKRQWIIRIPRLCW